MPTSISYRRALSVLAFALLSFTSLRSADVPKNLDELWAGFDPRKDPLEIETLKSWEQDGINCRIVRYQVGVFKGAPSKVAAFYAFPKSGTKLPAIIDIHGGGQSASLNAVITFAKRGYAAISLNWGGNKMNLGQTAGIYDGPQTDWGKLDATHPPQRNKVNHFAGALTPDDYTLDTQISPRNSNWYLVLIAARRAITFLEQQPEVDPEHIGVTGHSMGGKLTTNLAGIDSRIKAAVPSCGGSGDVLAKDIDTAGGQASKSTDMELACVSDNAYIPRISCPTLWLSPTNDFHAHIDAMAWNWRTLPDDRLRFSIAPHFNHRHSEQFQITQYLWFEEHLKGAFKMPQTPQLVLNLKTPDGIPSVTVTPDSSRVIKSVDIYFSQDPHELTRFWRDAIAVKNGDQWTAVCPVMNTTQALVVYANVVYELPAAYIPKEHHDSASSHGTFVISSRVQRANPGTMLAANTKATDKPVRMIDDGSRCWHDWYRLNWDHAPLWVAATRKLKDPKWQGPTGAKLVFEIQTKTDNTLVVTFNTNAWGAIIPNAPVIDYVAVKDLKGSADWQTVTISIDELVATNPKITTPPANWLSVTELTLSPHGETVKNGEKLKLPGKPWQGLREFRNMRWEGGVYTTPQPTPIPKPPAAGFNDKEFNDAIKKSLEQEKLDELKKK